MRDSDLAASVPAELGRTAKSTVFALFMTAIGLGANYLFNVAIAHWFGPADFGLFAAGYALLAPLAAVAVLGLDAIVLREATAARARGDLTGARAILRRAAVLVLVAGCLIAAGLAVDADSITNRFFAATPGIAPVLQSFAPAVPAIAVGVVALTGLQAMQDVKIRMTLRYGLDPLLRFGFGATAYAIGASILGAVVAVAAASVATALAAFAALHRLISKRGAVASPRKAPAFGWVALLGASWPLTLALLCDMAVARSDTLLLLSLAGAPQVGLYSAAQMTAAMITILLMVVETIMSPLFAERIARSGIRSVAPLFRLGLRWVTLLAVPGFLFFAIAAPEIMGLFGADFRPAATAFVLLAAGHLINCLTGSANYILILSGKVKLVLLNTIVYGALLIVVNFLAIKTWGIVGAAAAMLATTLLINLARLIEVWFLFRIHPFTHASSRPIAIGALLWAGASLLLHALPGVATLLVAASTLVAYAAVILAIGLDPEDRQLVVRALGSLRR